MKKLKIHRRTIGKLIMGGQLEKSEAGEITRGSVEKYLDSMKGSHYFSNICERYAKAAGVVAASAKAKASILCARGLALNVGGPGSQAVYVTKDADEKKIVDFLKGKKSKIEKALPKTGASNETPKPNGAAKASVTVSELSTYFGKENEISDIMRELGITTAAGWIKHYLTPNELNKVLARHYELHSEQWTLISTVAEEVKRDTGTVYSALKTLGMRPVVVNGKEYVSRKVEGMVKAALAIEAHKEEPAAAQTQ